MDYGSVKRLLEHPKEIVITTHMSPDGDAIGSSMGLKQVLSKFGHRVTVIAPDAYPEFLAWMDPNKEVLFFNREEKACNRKIDAAEVVFSLDYNQLRRIGENFGKKVGASGAVKILIDHHQQPGNFPDYTLSDSLASSTAQLVYDFLEHIGWHRKLNLAGAEALYAGIMTDTGNFRFSNTSSHTHLIVSRLLEFGVRADKIYHLINDQNSLERIKLLGHLLVNRMKYLDGYNTIIFWLSLADQKDFNYKKGDTEGFVNYGLSVKGAVFSIFITEAEDKVKLSFRSKGRFNVHEFAKTHFEGGGHINAAGGMSRDSLEHTVEKLEAVIGQYGQALSKPFKEKE